MSVSVTTNRTDTAVEGVSSLALTRAVLNFGVDFAVKSDEPNELIVTNLTSPIDAPEKFRFAVSEIRDIYKNSGIDPTKQSASKRGVNLLVQLTDVWTVVDSVDATLNQTVPIEGHIVLKIPANQYVTEDMLVAFVGRLTSGLFGTGEATSVRLKSMVRGSLKPSDI